VAKDSVLRFVQGKKGRDEADGRRSEFLTIPQIEDPQPEMRLEGQKKAIAMVSNAWSGC